MSTTSQKDVESSQTATAPSSTHADTSDDLRVNVSLVPELPRAGDTFRAVVQPHTPDSHPYLDYQWLVNGQEMAGERGEAFHGRVVRGDKVSVRVTPSYGTRTGLPVTVSCEVVNSPPLVHSFSDTRFGGGQYQTHLMASDPDGDPLTFTILEGPEGIKIDSEGWIRWEPRGQDMGKHLAVVSVKDDQGGEIVYAYSFTLGMSTPSLTKE
jgi:hypothetical protein